MLNQNGFTEDEYISMMFIIISIFVGPYIFYLYQAYILRSQLGVKAKKLKKYYILRVIKHFLLYLFNSLFGFILAVLPIGTGVFTYWLIFEATNSAPQLMTANFDSSSSFISQANLIIYRNGRFGTCMLAVGVALVVKVVNLTVNS